MPGRVVFLPGALGAAEFWQPVGALLPEAWDKVYLRWPGLGAEDPDPAVRGLDDLVGLVEAELDGPCDLVAQSMGGVVAARVALRRPQAIRRLVLVATSAGIDVAALGAENWRAGYRRGNPRAAAWIIRERPDLTAELPSITAPTLLIWGDSDPISPVAVGEALASLLPDSRLVVIAGGTHALAVERAPEVAPAIAEHLSRDPD